MQSVTILSMVIQLAAAALSFRLIRLTGRKLSWLLISAGFLLMTVRRGIALWQSVHGTVPETVLFHEWIGLLLSLLMLSGVAGIRAVFVERNRARERVEQLLREKELVLKEVHHRIKNNMAVVAAVFSLEAGAVDDARVRQVLDRARGRVQGMQLLYDKLYREESVQQMPVRHYLPLLLEQITGTFQGLRRFSLRDAIDDFVLDSSRLQQTGMLVNELLCNAFKHAVPPGDLLEISVSLRCHEGCVILEVCDNGQAAAQGGVAGEEEGFGQVLVGTLVQQLHGVLSEEIEPARRSVRVEFPL